MKRKGITKEDILTNTIGLIRCRTGMEGITVREIAKETGCSAANIYNHFNSIDELAVEMRTRVFTEYFSIFASDIEGEDIGTIVRSISKSLIDYAIANPGLYSLLYVEKMPPFTTRENGLVAQLRKRSVIPFFKVLGTGHTFDDIYRIAKIVHGYLHGEICRMISGRIVDGSLDNYRMQSIENAAHLTQQLAKIDTGE